MVKITKSSIMVFFFIILIGGVSAVEFSDDRTRYYNFGNTTDNIYGADGINSTDQGLNGNIGANGISLVNYGWSESGASNQYTSSYVLDGYGSVSFVCGGESVLKTPALTSINSSFTGITRMSVYCTGLEGFTVRFYEDNDNYVYRLDVRGKEVRLAGYEADNVSWIDNLMGGYDYGHWFNISLEMNGSVGGIGTIKATINDTPMDFVLGYGFYYSVAIAWDTNPDCYIDNFMITNGALTDLETSNNPPTRPTLISPADESSTSTVPVTLKYNSTDEEDPDGINITFYVYNSTDNVNFDLLFNGTGFGNTSFDWGNLGDGNYYWKVKAGDGKENSSFSSSYKFTVSTTAPSITLKAPANNKAFSTLNISSFNFTTTDTDGISACELWHNLSGDWALNETSFSVSSGVQFYFNQTDNLTDQSSFIYNIWCNDTLDNGAFYPYNFSFKIDTIEPSIKIDTPLNSYITLSGIPLKFTITDHSGLSLCKYNITYSASGIIHTLDTDISCDTNTTFSVDTYSSYTLGFTALDNAGNYNYSSSSFSVSQETGTGSSGGGSASSIPITQCSKDDDCLKFGDKYVCVQGFCVFQEKAPVCNYNGICEPERGENLLNCGDKMLNETVILEGDCDPISFDLIKIAFSSQVFLTISAILLILSIIYLNVSSSEAKPVKRFKGSYRKFIKRFKT